MAVSGLIIHHKLKGLRLSAGKTVYGQRRAGLIIQCIDILYDGIAAQFLWADDFAKIQAVQQCAVSLMTQLGDHLIHTTATSIHRNHHIDFIHTCHSNQRVTFCQPLTIQQIPVRSVSQDNIGFRKPHGHVSAKGFILFNNMHIYSCT